MPAAGEFSPAEKEGCSLWGIFPCWILLWVMCGLLLLATLRSFFQPAKLLVAWGDDGGLPAVCYSSCPSPGLRQYTVLCPGGSSAATQLLFLLDKHGCARLECIFSSTAAPAPRGVRVLLKKKKAAALILLVAPRRQKSGFDLVSEARSAGIAVQERNHAPGVEPGHHQHWEFQSWRERNGDLHWSFLQLREQVQVTLSWQKNGILQLQYQDRKGNRITKQFSRSNRCGTWSKSPQGY